MAFSFPTSPTLNQQYTFGTKTWRFNGTGWVLVTGVDAAQSAWSTANLAYINSNTATVLAQGAFNTANSKFDKVGGTITGNTYITKDLTVGGNLSVLGNTFSINAGSIQSNSTVLLLGIGNYATDALDIGFAGHYNAGTNAHTGLIRDSGTKEWYLFKNYVPEIVANNNIIISDPSFTVDTLHADLKGNTVLIKTIDILPYANSIYDLTNAAFNSANSGFLQANSAFIQANAVFNLANAAYGSQNTSGQYANSAFIQANAAFSYGNATATYANSAFAQANAAFNHANASYAAANNVFPQIQPAFNTANAAFLRANNSLNANAGGQITGDVTITGNLIVSGNTVYANAQTVLIADNIITLNAAINQTGAPTMNAGIEVDRGNQPNVGVIWNESTQKWTFTNDGSTYSDLGSGSGSAGVYANGAFIQANSAYNHANAAFNAANTGGGSTVTFGANPPATGNSSGDIWIDSADGTEYTYFSDINSYQWVEFGPTGANVIANTFVTANISAQYTQANLAFSQANTAWNTGNSAFIQANAAFLQANTPSVTANAAFIQANAAFNQANTANTLAIDSTRLAPNLKLNIIQVLESANIFATAISGNVNIDIGVNTSYFF